MVPINLDDKLAQITGFWQPHVVAELNGQHVKLAKLEGEFIWHHHPDEDELFHVLRGRLTIELVDGAVTLGPGECVVIPRGVEHRPVAHDEVHVLLFEPAETLNTGNIRSERTIETPRRI